MVTLIATSCWTFAILPSLFIMKCKIKNQFVMAVKSQPYALDKLDYAENRRLKFEMSILIGCHSLNKTVVAFGTKFV